MKHGLKKRGDFYEVPTFGGRFKEMKVMDKSHAQSILNARQRLAKKKGYL